MTFEKMDVDHSCVDHLMKVIDQNCNYIDSELCESALKALNHIRRCNAFIVEVKILTECGPMLAVYPGPALMDFAVESAKAKPNFDRIAESYPILTKLQVN